MTEIANRTDIYLVPGLSSALTVARELGAKAVQFDLEGVLGNYVGNTLRDGIYDDFLSGQGAHNMLVAKMAIKASPFVAFGINTNNTNKPNEDFPEGLVSSVAGSLDIPFAHKGMEVDGIPLKPKPSGEIATHLCEEMDVAPEDTVLIDDQGVKNAGEAVNAGLKAIIVPRPIGLPHGRGDSVVEHKWVRRGRRFEPGIYTSLETQGRLARIAYRRLAGIDVTQIGTLHNYRQQY